MKYRQNEVVTDEKQKMQSVVGQLNWLSTQTRPDISFDICDMSSKLSCATVDDLLYLNKVIKKVKNQEVTLKFSKLIDLSTLAVECYSDASFGNLMNGGSQGGYVIFITDQYSKRNVVSWQSKRIRRVVKSTLAAETMPLLDAAEAGIYIATLIAQALNMSAPLVKCYVDNKSLVDAVLSSTNVEDKIIIIISVPCQRRGLSSASTFVCLLPFE